MFDTVAIPEIEILSVLESILATEMFLKAPRMSRLLDYLVRKAIAGAIRDTNEYAIGIEVFDRDASNYHPASDPIVRVQVGRLRAKLKAYYASLGANLNIKISIPVGSYMPIIQRIHSSGMDFQQGRQGIMLVIQPFDCISLHGNGVPFTQGLNEELIHQLFKKFGKLRVIPKSLASSDADCTNCCLKKSCNAGIKHLIEGNIRIDAEHIRTSIRLIDISVGCITWSEQFDRNNLFSIMIQEELALTICEALISFFESDIMVSLPIL